MWRRSLAMVALLLTMGAGSLAIGTAAKASNYCSPVIHAEQSEAITALIVRYERGYTPRGRVLGISRVTGAERTNLRLGPALGERMWRVDFIKPVDLATAKRVAKQLASHPAVAFAEPDRKVTAFGPANGPA